MLGQAFQPRLLDPPVLDLRRPSIHEALALQAPVEEGALADVGLKGGYPIGFARDRLCREARGERADVKPALLLSSASSNINVAVGGGPDQNLRPAAGGGEGKSCLQGQPAQIETGAERRSSVRPRDCEGAKLYGPRVSATGVEPSGIGSGALASSSPNA